MPSPFYIITINMIFFSKPKTVDNDDCCKSGN